MRVGHVMRGSSMDWVRDTWQSPSDSPYTGPYMEPYVGTAHLAQSLTPGTNRHTYIYQ